MREGRPGRFAQLLAGAAALHLGVLLACVCRAEEPIPVCREPWGRSAFRVACLGDSNTHSGWQSSRPDGFPREEGWCERLSAWVGTINCGWGGATASPNASGFPHFQGAGQLEAALADPRVDLVILALGTNDVGFSLNNPDHLLLDDPTPVVFAEEILFLADEAEEAGAWVLIATSPYRVPPTDGESPGPEGFNDRIAELNAELVARVDPSHLLDFTNGFEPEDYLSDGLHLGSSGMALRAEIALDGLVRLVPEPAGPALGLLTLGLLALLRAHR